MALCIKEHLFSWSEQYEIYDEDQHLLYSVRGEAFSFGHKIHIYDAAGNEVAYIHEKVWSFLKNFEIFLHGEKKGSLKEKFSFFHPKFAVDFLDCTIDGDIFEWNYEVTQKGQQIGLMQRKILSWGNVYYLSCPDQENELALLTLSLAIDAAHHDEENAAICASSGTF